MVTEHSGEDKAATRSWSQLVETFDAFVLVTPEYNHSTSAALKNALDHLYLPGVAIAHVRRNDLSDDKDRRFSEMAGQ
jgi:NAD(P)H-dependent FMN reductase